MIRQKLHHLFCLQSNRNLDWFREQLKMNPIPFSSSYDIRDSGFKISNVDANIFPAGFNNICTKDHRHSSFLARDFLKRKYGSDLQRIALVAEEHTQNPFYWDNVLAIRAILQAADFKVLLGFPRRGSESWTLDSSTGEKVEVISLSPSHSAFRDFRAQLLVSNNDFSLPLMEWAADIEVPIEPGRHLGWHQRRKSRYFFHYNALVHEFCQIAGIDEFLLNVETEAFPGFDLNDEARMQSLARNVDALLARLQKKYSDR
ncbi:MAG: glutamate--cysteine ligase, partial [Bdellovibrio sp.]